MLFQGIPEAAELPPAAGALPVPGVQAVNPPAQPPQATQPAAVPSTGPNANPLDLFPQVLFLSCQSAHFHLEHRE